VWVDPPDQLCDLTATIRLGQRARGLGLPVMLDFHYADSWADPGQQPTPARWRAASGTALEDSVRNWTRAALRTLRANGVVPEAVQIGNEVTNGFLWPDGRLESGSHAEWARFAGLMRAAADGVRAGAPRARVLVHIDRGGDAEGVKRWFRRLDAFGVRYDDIALSWYPWWHGGPHRLERTLRTCEDSLRRDVWIVETAYPWTVEWFDSTHKVLGAGTALGTDHPASPGGQRRFLDELLVRAARSKRVRGVFWSEPADRSAPRRGSAWENCALFDATGRMLPAAGVMRRPEPH
ncbi:MAG: hypothetical protein HOP12_16190, partial [Candidatus Eisenbacteria bacterium]|nr:hypothetical protein [Candidatus Eisenbacteria bacterium]